MTREVLEHSNKALEAIKRTRIDRVTESGDVLLSYPYAGARELIVNELLGDFEEQQGQEEKEAAAAPQNPADAHLAESSDQTTTKPPSSRRLPPAPNASLESFNAVSLSSLPIKFAASHPPPSLQPP